MQKFIISPRRILQATVTGLLITITAPLWADSAIDDAINKRAELMKNMGNHMKAIKKILGGATDAGTVQEHSAGLKQLTNDLAVHLKELFPANSDQGDSSAQAAIWQNWADFEHIAHSLASKGKELQQASEHGDSAAITPAYKELGEVCKSCHKDYRAEK